MSKVAEWIDIDPSRFNDERTTTKDGVELIVGMSPYDLPDGVRGYYADHQDQFVIQFRYLSDDEPQTEVVCNEHVKFFVGVHSKRLYAIHVDVCGMGANSINLKVEVPEEITRAFKGFTQERHHSSRAKNYSVAGKVLLEQQRELLSHI